MTDIDILSSVKGINYAFELKNYSKITTNDLINFKKDIETLRIYSERHPGTKAVFLLAKKPANMDYVNILYAYGKKNNVKILFGDAETVVKILEYVK